MNKGINNSKKRKKTELERKRKVSKEQRMTLGRNLRERRRYLNITQSNVAKELGITTTAYSKIERGESGVTVDRIRDLSTILDISVPELISRVPLGGFFMKELYTTLNALKEDVHAITTILASEDNTKYGKDREKDAKDKNEEDADKTPDNNGDKKPEDDNNRKDGSENPL